MAQLVMDLLCKHKDLSTASQHPWKKPDMTPRALKFYDVEREDRKLLGLNSQLVLWN